MRFAKTLIATATTLLFAGAASAANINTNGYDAPPNGRGGSDHVNNGHNQDSNVIDRARPGGGGGGSNGIFYHGGPVMVAPKNIYYIWYGNWSGNTATTILANLASNIGGSNYFKINTTYTDGSGAAVSNSAALAGQRNDNYSQGKSLSDAQIQSIVAAGNPTDTNGVYFVLTSSDVTATSGFCTNYCGWHTHATINGRDIKYSFVGNPDACPSACEDQSSSSPNNNPGADGMASIIAHEFEEAASDPDLNAWYDRRGQENADKCAWTFGTVSTASNGSSYNVTLGGSKYLIQQNWVNAGGGYCAMSY